MPTRKGTPVTVEGVEYPSFAAAAKHYGKPEKLFRKRIVMSGLTPEQALEIDPFPDWFVPGKGQFARARGDARRAAEKASGIRQCGTCKQKMPISYFHKRKGDLLSFRCKKCTAAALIRARYGLSESDFAAMAMHQGNRCAICFVDLELDSNSVCRRQTVAVDHCHATGKVRGLLCNKCNAGLGSFDDSEKRLLSAINYLRQPTSESLLLD